MEIAFQYKLNLKLLVLDDRSMLWNLQRDIDIFENESLFCKNGNFFFEDDSFFIENGSLFL